jgi:hypothetical protein
MTRQCTQCKTVKNLNVLNFLQGKNRHDTGEKQYFSYRCRKCHYKNEVQLRKDRRNVIKPSKGMHYIRQALIGHKEEPYFEGENYEYKAPTLTEILKEYELHN